MASSLRSHTGVGVDRIGAPNDPIIRALWERRIEQRLTRVQVARRAGVSMSSILTAERGIHNPRLDILRAWAGALDMELSIG